MSNPLSGLLDLHTPSSAPPTFSWSTVETTSPLTIRGDLPDDEPAPALAATTGLTSGARVLTTLVGSQTVVVAQLPSASAWRPLILNGSWAAYTAFGRPRVRREGDVVRLAGVARGGTGGADDPIAALPPDCRPSSTRLLHASSGATALDLRAGTDGSLYLNAATSPYWASLEGLTFSL